MSDGDAETLAAIRARAERADPSIYLYSQAIVDVRWLLARVGQLEAENRRLRDGWRPLPDGGLVAPIPEHLFKCPPDCTDETPIVSVGWSTPTREVMPYDDDFDPASLFVQHKPDPDNNTTHATHASGLEHELPYDTRVGTKLGGVGK